MRDVLIHGYARVDNSIVWTVVADRLSALEQVLREVTE
jgi:uncharacterized protein with HEPN domain